MKNKKLFAFIIGALMSANVFALLSNSAFNNETLQTSNTLSIQKSLSKTSSVITDGDESTYPESGELSRDFLCIDIKNGASTPKAKSYTVAFTSFQISAFKTADQTSYVVIDDEEYSGNPRETGDPDTDIDVFFNGYIYKIEGTEKTHIINIPAKYDYTTRFEVVVSKIAYNACPSYTNVETINIPASITSIDADAFKNVPENVVINCGAESKPDEWDDNWTDAKASQINWGVEFNESDFVGKYGTGRDAKFGDAMNFMLGYKDENINEPLKFTYDVIRQATGERETITEELGIESTTNPYDAVGSNLGQVSTSRIIDITVNEGDVVDAESFVFSNIHAVNVIKEGEKVTYELDDTKTYYAKAVKGFANEIDITTIVNYQYKGVSTFAGYTSVCMTLDLVTPSPYSTLMPQMYAKYEEEILRGDYTIRYAFYNLTNASYLITYESNGEKKTVSIPVSTPVAAFELTKTKGNELCFLVKNSDVADDFTASKLRGFDLVGASISLHLWNVENSFILTRSHFTRRFGHITVMPEQEVAATVSDMNLITVLTFVGYTVLLAIVATALFFFLKEKYKNDEFRRMKPKSYIKKTILAYIGVGVLLLFVLFVFYRNTLFNNAIAVYNPTDPFIVLAGVVGVVIAGYFIKFLVTKIKTDKQNKERKKLKIDQDVAQDGTN